MGRWLIHHELERQARWRGGDTAFVFEGTEYTYAAFDRRVNRAARALRDGGVDPGDRIAVHGKNHVDLHTLFYACSKAGAVYSPISTFQSRQNVAYIGDTLDPRYVFYTEDVTEDTLPDVRDGVVDAAFVSLDGEREGDPGFEGFLNGHAETAPARRDDRDATATHSLFWTSGTTGRPKAVVRDHEASLRFADPLIEVFPFGPDNVRLTTNDMMFTAPYLQYGLPTVMSGATNVILRTFTPEAAFEAYEEYGVTLMLLVFTQGTAFLDYLEETDRSIFLRALLAIVPSAERARELAGLADELYHFYATTETGVVAVSVRSEPYGDPPAIGRPGRSVDIRVHPPGETGLPDGPVVPRDRGELLVRGDTTMTRYLEDEHQTEKVTDGWIHTGDLIKIDDAGDFVFVGRLDDRIRSGGINVYPSEVEAVLVEHPDVADAFVVGVADDFWGQRICALGVTDGDVDTDRLERELDERCQESEGLTHEMRPKTYAFVTSRDAVPTGAVNKIDRGGIVEQFFERDGDD